MKWALVQLGQRLHVVPMGDLREHDLSPHCWCHPARDEEQPCMWSHNSMDRREHTTEQGVTH